MSKIGFIGLGNMGRPMVSRLVKSGCSVKGFDIVEGLGQAAGCQTSATAKDAVDGVQVLITMLPSGKEVRDVYLGSGGVLASLDANVIIIDCSTIDVETACEINAKATALGLDMVDAPVSGGVAGAAAGTLTFMVGGTRGGFQRAKPILQIMGENIIHTGVAGSGEAVKLCNNMMLAVSMIGTSEALVLAERLGIDCQILFDVVSQSTGQSWALTSYCPAPGPVPKSPANKEFKPGFTTAMMLKDLRLAQRAGQSQFLSIPLTEAACQLYADFDGRGNGELDFSGIIELIRDMGR